MTGAAATSGRSPAVDWQGPGAAERRQPFAWQALVWTLVFPPKRHRISPTLTGVFLMVLAMGIGTAAYNTASNILFIALSLLLACLLLSGLMSWFNFMGVSWRMRPEGPWRVGHETLVAIEVRNAKRLLPTYGLWFDLATHPWRDPVEVENDGKTKVKEVLAAAEKDVEQARLFLRERLEPAGAAALDWVVKPVRRGEAVVELTAVGSLFPFGFLRKNLGSSQRSTVLVWPALVDYQSGGGLLARSGAGGERTARSGTGEDLLALRKYATGDSHRLIHWKATARLRKLMVRQFAAESHDGYSVWVETPAEVWSRPEQFELLCSLAGTMAEDLFTAGRLRGVIVNDGPYLETRRQRDVEAFLDRLAQLRPVPAAEVRPSRSPFASRPETRHSGAGARKNLITFAPEGARGVAAYVDGSKTASA